MKLENTRIIYHQEMDQICIVAESSRTSGLIASPSTRDALVATVAWACRGQAYEPFLYRWITSRVRAALCWVLRRPVNQGRYSRTIAAEDGSIVITVTHYGKSPARIPFLKREVA